MGKHFVGYPMDTVILLLNKVTKEKEGRILARWTDSGMCRALVQLYSGNSYNGIYVAGEGYAGGYGYDKFSSAVADACRKCYTDIFENNNYKEVKHPINIGDHETIKSFVFCNTPEERNAKKQEAERLIAKKIIPIYSGAGNTEEAFSLYFDYMQAF